MKKTYALAALMAFSFIGWTQTETAALCYGWGSALTTYELPEAIIMTGYDQSIIDAEDAENDLRKDQPWRFGYKYDTNINPVDDGQWLDLEEGRIWRTIITCPGAMTVNLLLSDFYLPEGATLFLYDLNRTNKIGAYTHQNNRPENELGTELIHGESIIIEYFEPYTVTGEGSFTITNVIHGYRSLDRIQKDLSKGLNDSGNCNIDVECPLGEEWDQQIRSVAMIVVGGNGICSGALVNNTCEDGRFLFLTANHCLGGSTANWSFRFNWNSPEGTESCATTDGSENPGPPYDQTANGATVLTSSGGSDFALLEIDNMTDEEAEDWSVFYAGWDNSDAETVTEATGIHHPSGDLKKICREDNDPYHDATGGAQVWWIDDWDQGVTEPGSSGSPLFDQNKRIIGQLYGGAAACGGGDGTDDNDAFDYYGRFGISWDLGASEFLAPDVCDDATTLDGMEAAEACSGEISATTEEPTCFGGESGSISVSKTGGEGPYTYDIGDGPVDDGLFTGLGAGEYTITVIDADGCEDDITVTLSSPAAMGIIAFTEYEISGSDGSIDLSVSGGTPGYTYSWSGPGGYTSTVEDPEGLIAGLYTVIVTDANGCTKTRDEIEVKSAVSVEENVFGIRIYPNPSQGVFTIYNEGNQLLMLNVFDLSGRTIFSETINSEQNELIDLTGKSNGTYIVELTTETGKFVQRIIKK